MEPKQDVIQQQENLIFQKCELLSKMRSSLETKIRHVWLLHADSLSQNSNSVWQHLHRKLAKSQDGACRLELLEDEVKIKN